MPFFLLLTSNVFGQLQNNNWTFGYGGGVNFSGANPVSSLTSISSNEPNASVSDPVTGQLLFYTDARNVWNINNQLMPNGAGLQGRFFTSSTQGVLFERTFSLQKTLTPLNQFSTIGFSFDVFF
jgi:hypothetical protein